MPSQRAEHRPRLRRSGRGTCYSRVTTVGSVAWVLMTKPTAKKPPARPTKGGSPKKAIKRLRRKAVATLRQARLTAQLELVAADAAAAKIREEARAMATDEGALIRAETQAEVARLL